MNRFLRAPFEALEWVITDEPGVNKVNPPQYFADYGNNPQGGTDHFSLRTVKSARVGQTIYLTVQSISFTGSPVPYAGFLLIYNTNPDGTDNPDGRQRNRRTEFKILEIGIRQDKKPDEEDDDKYFKNEKDH